ncbi:serine hydrolase [Staphylococcus schweitzeri]|uniref:Beta-lactamase class A catalytic domain-containing protein n=1 Tax=Staphylococcus schweitzeri TaxID=1654388 RepID=A0A077ULJ7_9STAP|nr:serine hydrolase [Staphylococcus schweitzeri]CDR29229.1 hypothetical protein ERS140147_02434 [Staphylococcus schweitzeri]
MKRAIKYTIIIFFILVIIYLFLSVMAKYYLNKNDPDYVMNFINENPHKSAMIVKDKGEIIYSHNSDKKMRVASLFKLGVAIEFLHQKNNKKLNSNKKIKISEIDEYNIFPKTNPHYLMWKKKVKNKYVNLNEVVKGMLTYSLNPNTDYLIDILGERNVNKTLRILTAEKHEKITKISSTIAIFPYLLQNENFTDSQIENYVKYSDRKQIENLIKKAEEFVSNNKNNKKVTDYFPSEKEQELWSEVLPMSTAEKYLDLLEVASKELGVEYRQLVDILSNSKVENTIEKSGKTINIENKLIYIKNKKHNKKIIIMTNNLNTLEKLKIEKNLDEFIKKVVESKYKLGG